MSTEEIIVAIVGSNVVSGLLGSFLTRKRNFVEQRKIEMEVFQKQVEFWRSESNELKKVIEYFKINFEEQRQEIEKLKSENKRLNKEIQQIKHNTE